MRLPYKLSALLLALALLTGCTAQDRPLEVALVLKTTVETAEFWEQVMDGVYSAVDEFGVQLTVASPPSETAVEEQIAIMEETIQASPDVIILTSSDYDRLAPVTEAADAAGICVITMDSDVHSDVRKTFVASDNYQIGLELGRRMRDVLDAGQVAVLTHSTVASSGMFGSFVGATVLTVLPEVLRGFSEYRQLVFGALLVILMLVRPEGLFGSVNFKYIGQRLSARRQKSGGGSRA